MITRMTLSAPLALACLVLATAFPASAAEPASDRFQIEKTKYGFVRLDRQTGAMTFCREDSDALVCDPVATAKTAVEDQVQAMKGSVDAMAARLNTMESSSRSTADLVKSQGERLAATEAALKDAIARLDEAANAPVTRSMPSDEELDSTFNHMQKIMRRFLDMARELDQEQGLPGNN